MPPTWLTLAWISLASVFVCAAAMVVRGYRQRLWIMDLVWPLTALYSGPLGWIAYRRWGRPTSPCDRHDRGGQSRRTRQRRAHSST